MPKKRLLLLLKPFDLRQTNAHSQITNPQTLQMLHHLENRCKEHMNTIKFCQNILQQKPVDWEPILRNNLSQPICNVDLVITVGGDGTLLQASHFMDDSVPVVGVNSDPTQIEEVEQFSNEFDANRSTGHLCAATVNNFQQVLDDILEVVSHKLLSTYALNDILIAHPCPATLSRFSFNSTASGSTAAMLSAGGFPMPILSQDLQYMVREPISLEQLLYIETTWFSKEGMIYIDGSHVCYSVQNGDTIEISSKAQF
ncbi:hypothetical protein RGQ29_027427 [Quercus rubra]|uniref:NADH kinase n=1 Tax=Quercus rubra TaxID=3512 RepID=A0AAN7EQW2_QUERU|nr:hypothetical protein RGQ29_027427 [Quercus rubra]